MRPIDADAAREATHREIYLTESARSAYRAFIRRQPTIDAVPVVRCKDCIWYAREEGCPLSGSDLYDENGKLPHATDFCSYGERKDGNE